MLPSEENKKKSKSLTIISSSDNLDNLIYTQTESNQSLIIEGGSGIKNVSMENNEVRKNTNDKSNVQQNVEIRRASDVENINYKHNVYQTVSTISSLTH